MEDILDKDVVEEKEVLEQEVDIQPTNNNDIDNNVEEKDVYTKAELEAEIEKLKSVFEAEKLKYGDQRATAAVEKATKKQERAKMTDLELVQEENNTLKEELNLLREKNLQAEVDILLKDLGIEDYRDIVVRKSTDIEEIREVAESLAVRLNGSVKEGVSEEIKNSVKIKKPITSNTSNGLISAEDFKKMGVSERIVLRQKDAVLYQALLNQTNK